VNRLRICAHAVSIAALAFTYAACVDALAVLPPRIATHFSGPHADGFGSKWQLVVFPVLVTALYAALRLIERMPLARMNLPVAATPENQEALEPVVRAFLACCGTTVVLTFAFIEEMMIASAGGTLWVWMPLIFAFGLAPLVLLGIFVPLMAAAGGARKPAHKS